MALRERLGALCRSLDMLACQRTAEGGFEPLHPLPGWLAEVDWGPPPFDLTGQQFSFLANFLIDAEEVWRGERERLDSGVWIEAVPDETIHLTATALRCEDSEVLVVRRLTSHAEMNVSILQKGREEHLRFENDLTHQEDLRRRLVEDREIALRLTAAKSEFLANMSHEIRTPLHSIVGVISLVLDSPLSDEQRTWLQGVLESAQSLNRIIDDVLDFSKMEAGKLDLERAPFDLKPLVEQLAVSLRPLADEKHLSFEWEVADDAPRTLLGDAGRLRQILLNLCGNALKFTDQGGVRVAVGCSSDRRHLLLDVADTGIGIPLDKQQAIFDSFSQADTSITRRFGGTGLGLSISSRLAHLMGGRIQLRSQQGQGSTFTLVLPLLEVSSSDSESEACGEDQPEDQPLRILVAEDSPMNQMLCRRLLERRGHSVEVVANGLDAVRRALAGDIDVILMDCQMPDMGGFEATRAIRAAESPSRTPVQIIATTAHAVKGYREQCLQAGMNDYLAKPFQPSQLAHVVAQAGRRLRNPAPANVGRKAES